MFSTRPDFEVLAVTQFIPTYNPHAAEIFLFENMCQRPRKFLNFNCDLTNPMVTNLADVFLSGWISETVL